MDSRYVDDLIDDDEIPELTDEDFAQMVPFEQLLEEEKRVLRDIMSGNVTFRPDPVKKPVTVAISSDVLDRFTASDEGWSLG